MNIEIITQKISFTIYGFSGTAINKDYAGTAFRLSDKMWRTVKENNIKNQGKNIWVYEQQDEVFAGIELEDSSSVNGMLEQKNIILPKYAYYKHVGSYSLLKQVGTEMRNEIKSRGFVTELPYIEIYGHWVNDDAKCETELFMCLV